MDLTVRMMLNKCSEGVKIIAIITVGKNVVVINAQKVTF